MAKLTSSRKRKALAENEIWRSAGGEGTGRWEDFAITVRDAETETSFRLTFNRAEAEQIATYFREMLDAKIDMYGRPI